MGKLKSLDRRFAGALMHPTSLPGNQGIGVLGESVDRWLDFLCEAGIQYWQICPLGPTGFGNSPYQCYSAFAGNPMLIDLEELVDLGLLSHSDLEPLKLLPTSRVNFDKLIPIKTELLRKAYQKWHYTDNRLFGESVDYMDFHDKTSNWLDDYVVFMALKEFNDGSPWWEWEQKYGEVWTKGFSIIPSGHIRSIGFHTFCQYVFYRQWERVVNKAHARGIQIIGDAPIYVGADSADVWSNQKLFDLDEKGHCNVVAGVPPDYFCVDGQRWGNAIYNWEEHKKTGYRWWIDRLKANFQQCDMLRIDHFRAFASYWAINSACPTARDGQWRKGPGMDFFNAVAHHIPNGSFIAEDLGSNDHDVKSLINETGLPGMAVLHFAFGGDNNNPYLPHNVSANTVLYPGTHDNNTTKGWFDSADENTKNHARSYLGVSGWDIAWDMIKLCYASKSNLVVIQLQDFLNLDEKSRFNIPGTATGNWEWRYHSEQLERLFGETTEYLNDLADKHKRI